jgi:hypothetical protein
MTDPHPVAYSSSGHHQRFGYSYLQETRLAVMALDGVITLVAMAAVAWLFRGDHRYDLFIPVNVDNAASLFWVLGIASASRISLSYVTRPFKLLLAITLALEVMVAIGLLLLGWHLVEGPLHTTLPIQVNVDGIGRPLLYLALLFALRPFIQQGHFADWDGAITSVLTRHGLIPLLVIVFGFALFLRLWGLYHGVGSGIYHVDAGGHIDVVKLYAKGISSIPDGYPYFGMHIVALGYRFGLWLVHITGYFPQPFAMTNGGIVAAARTLNVFFGLGVMAMLYQTALLFNRRDAGIAAAFLFGVSLVCLQMTKYLGNDLPMAFFSTVAVYFAAKNVAGDERLRWYLLAGIFAGIGFVIKYNGLLTFGFIGLVYIQRSAGVRDFFLHRIRYLLTGIGGFIAAFIATTPQMWSEPMLHLRRIFLQVAKVSTAHGVIQTTRAEPFFATHWTAITSEFGRHLWMFESLTAPVPLMITVIFLLAVAIRHPRSFFFLWLGAPLIFFMAKFTKPNAGAYQLMNVSAMMILAVAIGYADILRALPHRRAKAAMALIAVFYLGYHAVSDNSFWDLKPLRRANHEWVADNVIFDTAAWTHLKGEVFIHRFWEERPRGLSGVFQFGDPANYDQPNQFTIAHLHNGMPQAVTFWRDVYVAYWLVGVEHPPLFFPTVHFPSDRYYPTIYPDAHDLVVSNEVFSTPGEAVETYAYMPDLIIDAVVKPQPLADRPFADHRLIVAAEIDGPILLYGKNCANEPNSLYYKVGGVQGNRENMFPGQSFLVVIDNWKPEWLYYRRFVEVATGSEKKACWSVAADYQSMGDFYRLTGDSNKAAEAYLLSKSPYSLMRAAGLGMEPVSTMALNIAHDKYPQLFTDDYLQRAHGSWKEAAGYDDYFFAGKMTRDLEHTNFITGYKGPDGTALYSGGSLFGPYLTLGAGTYLASARWAARGATHAVFDVVADWGRKQLGSITLTEKMLAAGEARIPFTIDAPVEGGVEIRLRDLTGGDMVIERISITADYHQELLTVLDKALGQRQE